MNKEEFYQAIPKDRLRQIIDRTGSPAYVYFSSLLRDKVNLTRKILPDDFHLHYAVKANPHPEIIRTLAGLGVGADVASAGELNRALDNGVSPDKIEFSGPGKTESELALAISSKISSINVEQPAELEIIIRLCRDAGQKAAVGLRINPGPGKAKSGLRMAGETHFGLLPDQAIEAMGFIKKYPDLVLFTGFHVHTGSQMLKADDILLNMEGILDLALELEDRGGLRLSKVNFGGGWGAACFAGQKNLEYDYLAECLADLFQEPEAVELGKRAVMIVEPGRFLVAEAGIFAVRVLYRKDGITKKFAVVDGGLNHNYLLAGGMGTVIRRNFESDLLAADHRPPGKMVLDVAGPLCTPQDVLAVDAEFESEVRPGDLIVFFNCGAYGFSPAP